MDEEGDSFFAKSERNPCFYQEMQDTALKQMRLSQLFVLALNINMFYNKKNGNGYSWKERVYANEKSRRNGEELSFSYTGVYRRTLYPIHALRNTALF